MTDQPLNHSSRRQLVPVILLLLGFALRLYRIDVQALTGDEAFTIVNWTRLPLNTVFSSIALIDPQPPATMLTIIGWSRLVGDSVFGMRFLAALASTVTMAAVYGIGRALGHRRVAIVALALTAVNPLQLWYAQDIRGYGLWISVSTVAAWAFLLAIEQPQKQGRWAGYAAAAALGLYTYYLEAFLIIAQNVFVLLRLRERRALLKPWVISQFAIAALAAPWYLQPSLRSSGYQPTAGPVNLPEAFGELLFGKTIPVALNQTLFSTGTNAFTPAAIIAIVIIIAAIAVLARSRWQRAALFLPLYAVLPMLLLAVLEAATQRGFFRARYLAASSAAFILLAAFLIEALSTGIARNPAARSSLQRSLASIVALTVFVIGGSSLWTYYFGQSKAPRWPGIVEALQTNADADDIIVRNYPDPAFVYYYEGSTDSTLLPVSAQAEPAETTDALSELVTEYDHIWLLPVPSDAYDNQQIVVGWLLEHTQLLSEQWVGTAHIMEFAPWEVDAADIDEPVYIAYTDVATLRSVDFVPPAEDWQRGATVYVQTTWEPQQVTAESLTLFVHLLGPSNTDGSPLWAQDDHLPQYGRILSQTWQPGALFRDVAKLTIPADAPAGDYTVTAGFYDPATGDRVPLDPSVPQAERDGASLATFSLPADN